MKDARTYAVRGLGIGLLLGFLLVISTYVSAPSLPGMFELLLQLIIVGVFGAAGCGLGLLVGLYEK